MSRKPSQLADLEPLELWEYNLLISKLPYHWQFVYRILWETGIRIGECLNLKKSDVENQGVWVQRLKKVKKQQRDFIPLPPALYVDLQRYMARLTGINPRLFPYTGDGAWKALRRAAKEAGVRKTIHPHLFRHAFGRRMAKTDFGMTAMEQISLLSKMLGHSGIRYTFTYFNPGQPEIQEAWERMRGQK